MTDIDIIQGCITKSLTPHNDHGRPVRPADVMGQHIAELEEELARLDEVAWKLTGEERENLIAEKLEPMEERLRHCKAYLASIKDANWDEFELPNALGLDGCFANGLLNSRYPAEEVDRYVLPPPSSAGEPTPPEAESKPSRSAHAQACNTKCRRIAKRIWERQPDFTITAMIHHSEIAHQARKPDGTAYSEMTIRNWIRDLCPNPKPGRRAAVSLSRTIRT